MAGIGRFDRNRASPFCGVLRCELNPISEPATCSAEHPTKGVLFLLGHPKILPETRDKQASYHRIAIETLNLLAKARVGPLGAADLESPRDRRRFNGCSCASGETILMANQEARERYRQKLLDPRWQKRRLEILSRDAWTCQICSDSKSTLHVHHRYYLPDKEPWEYCNEALVTLCADCHREEGEKSRYVEHFVQSLKSKGLFMDDFCVLAAAIGQHDTLVHQPDVVASALCLVFEDLELQRELVERYFVRCRARGVQRKADGAGE